ncbi:MAG: 4,5-dihydroxyphthalate decarboxylase [Alphaproteobacteria bacterium]|nr:4,5-dihydroxyphthalate decarboxylase [Alphaproteobacteria bacterium]
MAKLKLTLALDRYDRHFPFFDETVQVPENIELEALQVGQSQSWRDGGRRHEQMYHDRAFDVCEFGLSPYVMLRERNPELPLIALPVFPRRLFSQSQIFVGASSGITCPEDLKGCRVALRSFHTTLSVLVKGDLKFHYGVPWEEIIWCTSKAEMVDYTAKSGIQVDALPEGMTLEQAIDTGHVDAIVVPHPPPGVSAGTLSARRLFRDCVMEEKRYFRDRGAFPIMHLMVMRSDLLAREPWLGETIMNLFAQAKEISEGYLDDPNWSRLAWGRHDLEFENDALGDPWPIGFKANRSNLAQFIDYATDQNLISGLIKPEDLFAERLLDS